jgi:hypothetical protein
LASRKPKLPAVAPDEAGLTLPDWSGLVGHEAVLERWRELLSRRALPQVVLLTGRAGIGKRSLLAALASLEGCASGAACGVCESCLWLLHGTHPEVLWLETPTERFALEDAARLQEHLAFRPEGGRGARVAVIVDADKLTLQAANRLLKILEEPPAGARILLSSSRVDALLPTILSRCVRWRVDPPPVAATLPWLAARAAELYPEGGPDAAQLEALLKRAGLSPGVALAQLAAGAPQEGRARELWSPEGVAAALAAAAEAVAGTGKAAGGSGLSACLDEWEIDLNAYYREVLARQLALDPRVVRRRRDILRAARALALRGKVPLSPLLTAEGLALAATKAT